MGQVLKGYFSMLAFNLASVPSARQALEQARALSAATTRRERAHVDALEKWVGGDMDGTLATWEQILDERPLDVLAFRLHHFVAFWYGRAEVMARQADTRAQAVEPGAGRMVRAPRLPLLCARGDGQLRDCRGLGPRGHRARPGRPVGRARRRPRAGNAGPARRGHRLAQAGWSRNWEGGNNLKHHLWWHRGLYHFERREFDQVLDLYDRCFRNLASPLTQAQPDMYIDVQNAASMLFRLERQGIDVGNRWVELADKAEARIGDCLSAFTLPHWMMALTATKRWDAAERMLEGMRAFASKGEGTAAPIVRDHALPICEAILARAKGDPRRACDLMRPALGGMYQLGGSHAQQDVLEQLFLDCAVKAKSAADVDALLARVTSRHPVHPDQRVGYTDARARAS